MRLDNPDWLFGFEYGNKSLASLDGGGYGVEKMAKEYPRRYTSRVGSRHAVDRTVL